ncbi:hypothetical protein GQ53DRAFT_652668 [Thozetella sp. PMI_491]|nr:hypothetical protein GQ53DRAFT_652668 [Thozetella sp. PMI_491]
MAPCARCCYIGAQCVTGAPGHPGRPPKHRPADGESTLGGTTASPADVSSPGPHRSTLRDMDHVAVHAPAMVGVPAPARVSRCRTESHTLEDKLHSVAGPYLAVPKSVVHPHSPRDPLAHEPQPDFWVAPGDSFAFFGSPLTDQSPALGEDILSLAGQLSSPSQLRRLLSAGDELDAMLHMGGDSSTVLDMDIDPLLDQEEGVLSPPPLPRCFSAASSLVGFREEIDQRIAMVDAYYSEPSRVLQRCKDEDAGRDIENPVASLLTCSKEFIDIIQGLTQTEDTLSTEIVLLALSSYLALMRLFDSLFHRIYKYVCQVPPESYKSIKVKSVLRIGGVSSLQDMPLKAYAIGILDAFQGQVQTLERYMGIPPEYCLSGEAAASPTAAAPGIFSRADRARLFWAVMAQEDVKSRRGSKSYVESIRASIKESMAFLDE